MRGGACWAPGRGRGLTPVALASASGGGGGQTENVVQKIWWGWMNGTSVVTSHLRDEQTLMVKEDGLADFVAEHG